MKGGMSGCKRTTGETESTRGKVEGGEDRRGKRGQRKVRGFIERYLHTVSVC